MATSTHFSATIKRAEPLVKNCFRNAFFHRPKTSGAASALSGSPQLVILFPWVGAKERYAHKFVDSWCRRGFNVLHVTTPVMDLIRPRTGTEVTASRVVDFLSEREQFNVILHGLSVGGYLGQRVLMEMQGSHILKRVSHQIYDSFTQIDGFHSGVENAVNPRYRNLVRAATRLYAKFADLSCLQAASDFIYNVPTPAPALFMHSLADKVGNYESVQRMLPYMARGSPVYTLLIPEEEKMPHVSLYRHMGEEAYMSSITRFLRSNHFTPNQEEVLSEEDPSSESARINIERVRAVEPKPY